MNLAVLHAQIRLLARPDAAAAPEQSAVVADGSGPLSPAEWLALRALQRRLHGVGGDLARLVPPAGSGAWATGPARVPEA